jgi:methyl-accepting chemotaxis protein
MKFQRRTATILISFIAISFSILMAICLAVFFRVTDAAEKKEFEIVASILQSRLTLTEAKAQQVGEMVARIPKVREYFAARDRKALHAELTVLNAEQNKKYGIENIHFIEPPSTSFLSMRAPDKFGTDLAYKPQVREAALNGVSKKGETINRTGPVIYAAVPVRDPLENLTGCVEIGIGLGEILDNLKRDHDMESALIVSEQQLKEVATSTGSDILNESNRVGSFYKFHSTNWELLKGLVSADDFSQGKATSKSFIRSVAGISYGVIVHPLLNYQGDLVGYIASASDFSASRSAVNRSILWMAAVSAICFLILVGLVLTTIRGGVARPLDILGVHYGMLAEGKADSEMPDTSRYFDEVRLLAAHYEKIRNVISQGTPIQPNPHQKD